jgi:hypothetical protein
MEIYFTTYYVKMQGKNWIRTRLKKLSFLSVPDKSPHHPRGKGAMLFWRILTVVTRDHQHSHGLSETGSISAQMSNI